MVEPLELLTERLRLRTPQIDDADAIQSIVADPRVALTTASIPHPYPENGAKGFILHVQNVASRDRRNLAIILRDGAELIGMVGYQTEDMVSELAYMVSPTRSGLGYASDACRAIVAHIFNATEAKAVIARAMADNKASEAVLRKLGFDGSPKSPSSFRYVPELSQHHSGGSTGGSTHDRLREEPRRCLKLECFRASAAMSEFGT